MPRKLITLSLLIVTFTACTPQDAAVDVQQALQLADQMRRGCVAQNLDYVTLLSDQLAPLCEARNLDHLIALAAGLGCSFLPGNETHVIDCSDMALGDVLIDLRAELSFLDEEEAPTGPGQAASLYIRIEATGVGFQIDGTLICTPDPARGLVLEGSLATRFDIGCDVTSDLRALTAQRVIDFADNPRLIFTSGSVDIVVDDGGEDIASGSAALVGRNALVALQVNGVFSHGEIALGQ